ncbi:MAG TPA: septum site-determining protein MinC [Trueperaceae bacterium]
MRTRGTRGGILLSIDADDTVEGLEAVLAGSGELLSGKVIVEVSGRVPWTLAQLLSARIAEAGGELVELRPPTAVVSSRGETRIISRTVRSGAKLESSGSIVVLGDVNAGAELIANDDIIVVGSLRGLAHAGAAGNENAVIWAQQILSPQLRIGSALAQSAEGAESARGPEVAHLREGAIVLRPWN